MKTMTTEFSDDMTLEAAQELLGEKLAAGEVTSCPCCERTAKVYKRTIHTTMARSLIEIYTVAGMGWCRPIDIVGKNSPDLVKTRWWGLMMPLEGRREDGSDRVGQWRITADGQEFINAKMSVPKYAHVYDNRKLRLSGPQVTIQDCLGEKFNYNDLMNS